ncbi:hypothetical protein CQW23_00973 [Capsicum baccatum]|uniref:Uncharacterized protein n=1 Tax=Capsicum baccatum TaxID=33114 RepID=A0A2G2XMB0_CAPBA|nr:hypothetical protein CQW23_00973 [Capsicum baccatum]
MPSPNLAGKPITESLPINSLHCLFLAHYSNHNRIMASSSGGGEDGLNSINPPSSKSQKIRQWLSFAVEREVEDVVFLSYEVSYVSVLPESFRTCSSLMTLHLRCHRFDDPGHSVEVSKEPKAGVCDVKR